MTNVLITGGGGFIGRATAVACEARDWKVWPYDASLGMDVRDPDRVLQAAVDCDADAIIHLAGVLGTHELFDTPGLAVDVNINGTLNVLEACRQVGAAFVGIAMPDVFPSIYTASKIAAMRFADAYRHTWGVKVGHVRAYNAYGIGQAVGPGHPQKIVPHFAVELANGRPIPIWGDGQQTVDLIHVDELGEALAEQVLSLDAVVDPRFDIGLRISEGGTGVDHTVLDVARMVAEALDCPLTATFLPMRRGETPSKLAAPIEEAVGTWRGVMKRADPRLVETVRWYAEQYSGQNDPWAAPAVPPGVSS